MQVITCFQIIISIQKVMLYIDLRPGQAIKNRKCTCVNNRCILVKEYQDITLTVGVLNWVRNCDARKKSGRQIII